MTSVTPSMRLKVKRDVFFLPDSDKGVYFRNNVSSFRMQGSTIFQWIEKLMPMFNGEHTLKDLTDGLPGPYRNRVFEIAEVLYKNGFVRDMSLDYPHQLAEPIMKKYASQIEFLNHIGNSGAARFQTYRQMKVLAIGSGSFFVSLVSALLESGLPRLFTLITGCVPTNRERIAEIVTHASEEDNEVAIEEIRITSIGDNSWKECVRPFDAVLYVSQEGNIEELRAIHLACKSENKIFMPAVNLKNVGLVGPVMQKDSTGCWESAWRRLHQTVLEKDTELSTFSSVAGAMLANVMVFAFFKEVTGAVEASRNNQFYLLNMETLEGNWHQFMNHPQVQGDIKARWVEDIDNRIIERNSVGEEGKWFISFSMLTSPEIGVFHSWEEGDLKQLPLAQCQVQVVNPLTDGPAELLPEIICSDLTHEEARREAGLSGIEAYALPNVRHLITTASLENVKFEEYMGIGSGETVAECICRGLSKCLNEELRLRTRNETISVQLVKLSTVEDERVKYYLQSLTTMQGAPRIGIGREIHGFPVAWINSGEKWLGCVGLNITMALQNVLRQAIMKVQNKGRQIEVQGLELSDVFLEDKPLLDLLIPTCNKTAHIEIVQHSRGILKANNKELLLMELDLEPFFKEKLAGVYGVLVREEVAR
ncbi:putative thiazole-containing bacteriocin maturation protein [Bacillus massiliigorillae]|uniref:putative thiazole-containing bacteriocin maturation protein n=1 Tax=Bacillus massiliigorillae TaxID=1243664 RepID=UPI0003A17926|nr:putative thiazole-containing bacteriocin maturation protein [Bacillus massiliigorillae]